MTTQGLFDNFTLSFAATRAKRLKFIDKTLVKIDAKLLRAARRLSCHLINIPGFLEKCPLRKYF